jgi:hypothetical protein
MVIGKADEGITEFRKADALSDSPRHQPKFG